MADVAGKESSATAASVKPQPSDLFDCRETTINGDSVHQPHCDRGPAL
jgi:hypothetical protein